MKTILRQSGTLALFACCLALMLMLASAFSDAGERKIVRKQGNRSPDVYCTPSKTDTEKRFALVMGNGDYSKISALRNPVNDAKGMADTLCKLGFEVMKGENLSQNEMKRAISSFGKKIRTGGVGLFYYAGHGVQTNGKNYLIPIGTNIEMEEDVEIEAVDVRRVLAEMAKAEDTLNIVILDACRNNPFSRSFRSVSNGLASMNAPSGTIIAYATAPGSVAADGEGEQNGLYTGRLLRNMTVPGRKIEDVFKKTRTAVKKATRGRQVSWESSSLEGDFYFAGGSSTIVRPKPPSPQKPVTGRLYVDTSPAGARIWIDGKDMGKAPLDADALKPGRVRVRAAKDGYEDEEASVRIRGGETTEFTLYLDKLASQPKVKPQAQARAWTDPKTGMEFVWVPAGCYEMGCGAWDGDCSDDEKPVHEVCVDGFWMGKYEVTQGQWKRIMGNNPSRFKKGDDHPVEQVSWEDAKKFIRKLNGQHEFRLPTEAEWEYAARSGGKAEKYSGGKDANNVAWHSKDWSDGHYAVGKKAPNGLGIYDMSGNIWERCEDIYASEAYGKHKRDNPIYASGGSDRVIRGGSWSSGPRGVRCANRNSNSPAFRHDHVGFRLVRTP